MPPDLLSAMSIGLVLGFRHAFEPDHVAAVTTLAGRHVRVWDAWRLGACWSLGHTAVIGLVVAAGIVLGLRVPEQFGAAVDLLIAGVLVALGAAVITRYARGQWHLHTHIHGGVPHLHLHSHVAGVSHHHSHPAIGARWALGMGLLHGLAGSGPILALLVATTPERSAQWSCFAAFGVGTTAGMLIVASSLWGLVRVASVPRGPWVAFLRLGTGAASIAAGAMLAARTLVELRG